MTRPLTASVWHDALKRAGHLHPDRIAASILETSDTGLRATRYDAQGGRTTFAACDDPHCDDGPSEHSHMVTSDPTGNAAVNTRPDPSIDELRRLNHAHIEFVTAACVVLDWVAGEQPYDWQGVLSANARLMPGTIQSGVDVDHEYLLPPAIAKVDRAVSAVERIAADHTPRMPTEDEKHWDNREYNDNDCCVWHLQIHRRYRRPRLPGKNICQDCVALSLLLGQRPPVWLLEAEVDRGSKPKAWTQALGRCMDELGVMREAG